MSKRIKLTQGKFALVDEGDFAWLNQWKWSLYSDKYAFYAFRNGKTKDGKRKYIFMHRSILGAKKGQTVDHIDSNGLNNRRRNMRICSHRQNIHNSRKLAKNRSSKFKGVSFNKNSQKWISYITVNGKRISLGYYDAEFKAAKAYNKGAKKYHGDFARINKIPRRNA